MYIAGSCIISSDDATTEVSCLSRFNTCDIAWRNNELSLCAFLSLILLFFKKKIIYSKLFKKIRNFKILSENKKSVIMSLNIKNIHEIAGRLWVTAVS